MDFCQILLVHSVYVLQMAVFYLFCHDGCVCDNKSPYYPLRLWNKESKVFRNSATFAQTQGVQQWTMIYPLIWKPADSTTYQFHGINCLICQHAHCST